MAILVFLTAFDPPKKIVFFWSMMIQLLHVSSSPDTNILQCLWTSLWKSSRDITFWPLKTHGKKKTDPVEQNLPERLCMVYLPEL